MTERSDDPFQPTLGETVGPADLGRLEARDSAIEDVAGAPTWPEPPTGPMPPAPPPVGLNWQSLANAFGWNREVLVHEGVIVAAGEYFPEEGYFVDPADMQAHHVDIGDMALRSGYFLGKTTVAQFGVLIYPVEEEPSIGVPVPPSPAGPVAALFASEGDMERARRKLVRNALASGIRSERGPLGWELRAERPEPAGRVATVMAHYGGAVVTIAGRPVSSQVGIGPSTTASPLAAGGDTVRPGTGSTGATQGPPAIGAQSEAVDGVEINSV
jgi:hypothetical protein